VQEISVSGEIAKKQSEGVRFVNSVLKLQCHIVKNALLQTVFSAILPTGYSRAALPENNLH